MVLDVVSNSSSVSISLACRTLVSCTGRNAVKKMKPKIPTPINTENTSVRVASSMWLFPWNWKYTNKFPKNMLWIREGFMEFNYVIRVDMIWKLLMNLIFLDVMIGLVACALGKFRSKKMSKYQLQLQLIWIDHLNSDFIIFRQFLNNLIRTSILRNSANFPQIIHAYTTQIHHPNKLT